MEVNRKRAKVHLLETKDESGIWSNKGRRLYYNQNNFNDTDDEIKYHLYYTTDDKIKEGDWVLEPDVDDKIKGQVKFNNKYNRVNGLSREKDGSPFILDGCKKIVATTNNSLGLPRPSNAFIEKYCELGGIDEVDIELNKPCCNCDTAEKVFKCRYSLGDIDGTCCAPNPNNDFYGLKIKVDSHNTITIHPIKDKFTREDIIHAIAYSVGESKKGFTHAEILQSYKDNFKI